MARSLRPDQRPSRWAPPNWPVRVKVLALVTVPLVLACVFGGLRISASTVEARELAHAADRAQMVPAVVDYMAALQNAMVTAGGGGNPAAALGEFDFRKAELSRVLEGADVDDSVRLATNTLLEYGQNLLDRIGAAEMDLRTQVMTFGPLLITAQTALTGSVGSDEDSVRTEADVLSRAVGARGQMAMQDMLVTRGGELPEPLLRSAMVTLAGTEPATVTAMGTFLGGASDRADALRSQMVRRMSLLSDPAVVLVGNPELLMSQKITADIAQSLINRIADEIPARVSRQADDARTAAIRDSVLVGAAILVALILVLWVARSLVRPLRTLRDSALRVAHDDLGREVERVRDDGKEFAVDPIPVHTTEEVGQVAHAVDELHQQALVLAGAQARLQLQVTDMFETLSRRNRSLVEQQLSLIDGLERDEEDPDRLQSLFQLDHLAARMRRNGANLLVLAGARISHDRAEPVAVAAIVNAAASEVEEYPRIVTGDLPDSEVAASAAGDLVHLLAELLDNGLRYSPPHTQVRVSAVPTGNNGLVIEVSDTGLGMTEADLRVANMRLESGGEVNPYTARHMGLFVVSRLAAQHGLVARLRSTVAGQPDSGTTAGVYIPARLLVRRAAPPVQARDVRPAAPAPAPTPAPAPPPPPAPVVPPASVLPQRRPEPPPPVETPRPGHADIDHDDTIYQKMLSEWLVDPHELSHSSDLNWKSVWDNGWSAAEAADSAPVRHRTPEGLPVRRPGARLIPGHADTENGHPLPVRDPDAVRASLGGHFGGVHAGRRHAREAAGDDR
ncbi:HAMP domain-containing sensor histidine kinase [Mycolicibacterium gilvum]|uniref:histidine kinase n=1 Tax=Mycolicibacterium gilvum (strain DSM 45189 / LMG 24558 / Spyr1) TaxID=278137 RepID=E6TCN7_MYCSR|nr:ATP-binding protein [Mycolicibacterium gilvum]ADU00863.1 signal transduction histidine kinase [Mycolicibacterium gilvum Spyr1]